MYRRNIQLLILLTCITAENRCKRWQLNRTKHQRRAAFPDEQPTIFANTASNAFEWKNQVSRHSRKVFLLNYFHIETFFKLRPNFIIDHFNSFRIFKLLNISSQIPEKTETKLASEDEELSELVAQARESYATAFKAIRETTFIIVQIR